MPFVYFLIYLSIFFLFVYWLLTDWFSYLFIHSSCIHSFNHLYIHLFILLFFHFIHFTFHFLHFFTLLSIYLFIYLFICLFIYLFHLWTTEQFSAHWFCYPIMISATHTASKVSSQDAIKTSRNELVMKSDKMSLLWNGW